MKIKEFKSLKSKDIKELKKLVLEKQAEISKKRMETVSGKEKNIKLVGNYRREVAKILTLIREKEILENIEGEQK